MIEWYDFALYFIMAPFIQTLFFPTYSKSTALLLFTIIFVLTYIARVIGGSFLASFSDRFGRKKIFVLGAVLMAVSAMMMAIFPIQFIHGSRLFLSLLILRVIQGISVGSETPGALVFTYEHAYQKCKMLPVGIMYAFSSLGCVLASLVCLMMSYYYSYQSILNYAWRIPYGFAAFLGGVLFFLRRKISETPAFEKIGQSSDRRPFAVTLKTYGFVVLLLTGAGLANQSMSSMKVIQNIYLSNYFHYNLHQIFLMNMVMYLVQCIEILFVLILLHFFRIVHLLYLCIVLTVIAVCPSYWLLPRGGYGPLLLWSITPDFLYTLGYLAMMKYLFSNTGIEVRTSVITVFTNIGALTGTLFPLLITFLLHSTGDPYIAPKVGWLISIFSFICVIAFIRHINKVPAQLNVIYPTVSEKAG